MRPAPKRNRRRSAWTLTALCLGALSGLDTTAAQERPRSFEEVTPRVRLAVARGFRYLLRRQKDTRSFTTGRYPVAVNALVGLAFLTGGHTERESTNPEYEAALGECTTTLLTFQNGRGYFDDRGSRMYGHGFATLFLAEIYGMSPGRNDRIRDVLRAAIKVIEDSQRPEGGWDYEPGQAFGGGKHQASDTSITVCQTMALRAARNLGLEVDGKVISRARGYIRRAQNDDGGFRYRSKGPYSMSMSEFPRSAAGVCILYSLAGPGDYSSPEIRSGIAYLERHYRESNNFPFYAQYYCSQAMFQVGGRRWREYFTWARNEFLTYQREDGSWRSRMLQFEKNPDQTTAMALIVLQLPYRFLPIHER